MSKTCGDTARFNRLRKQKIAHRLMVRELRAKLTPPVPVAVPVAGPKAS